MCTLMACLNEDEQVQADPNELLTYSNSNYGYQFSYSPALQIDKESSTGDANATDTQLANSKQLNLHHKQGGTILIHAEYLNGICELRITDPQCIAQLNIPYEYELVDFGGKQGIIANTGENEWQRVFVPLNDSVLVIETISYSQDSLKQLIMLRDQILSTFVFLDPTPSLDNPQPTLLQTSKIPLVDTSGWQTITQDGIVFQIPPSADFDNQSNPGNINWSWDYQNHTLNTNIKIYISDYKGGSRREAFYSAFRAEDASTCKHIYQEATFGKVSALQIANDGGSCQGGGGGIVTTIGDKLVILHDLSYTSTAKDINRWDIRDTIISTLRAEK